MDKLIFNIKIVKLLQFNENIDLIIPKAFEDPFTSKKYVKGFAFEAGYCSLTHLLILLVYFVTFASTCIRKC